MSIIGSTFYVNNATNLLALTIDAKTGTMDIKKRVKNTFPQLLSPLGQTYWNIEEDEIVMDWQIAENV